MRLGVRGGGVGMGSGLEAQWGINWTLSSTVWPYQILLFFFVICFCFVFVYAPGVRWSVLSLTFLFLARVNKVSDPLICMRCLLVHMSFSLVVILSRHVWTLITTHIASSFFSLSDATAFGQWLIRTQKCFAYCYAGPPAPAVDDYVGHFTWTYFGFFSIREE